VLIVASTVFVSPAVAEELKRIIRESEITKWVNRQLSCHSTGPLRRLDGIERRSGLEET
jgi:hypothetical protein